MANFQQTDIFPSKVKSQSISLSVRTRSNIKYSEIAHPAAGCMTIARGLLRFLMIRLMS